MDRGVRATCAGVCRRAAHARDVAEYGTSHEQFARTLRHLLRLEGPFQLLDDPYWDTVLLGTLRGQGDPYDVFLCVMTWHRTLNQLLAERMAVPRRTIVLVPTSNGVSLDIVHRHIPGGRVVLGFLADVVAVGHEGLILDPGFDHLLHPVGTAPAPFCMLFDAERNRLLTLEQYEAFIKRADEFDLFLDATFPRAGKRYVGGKRDERGVYIPVALSRNEALAFVELVSRAAVTRASGLACLRAARVATPVRVVEIARKKLDLKLGHRYKWRSLHAVGDTHGDDRSYLFKPPAGLRYAILAPAAE
jgi:hypothetical protein